MVHVHWSISLRRCCETENDRDVCPSLTLTMSTVPLSGEILMVEVWKWDTETLSPLFYALYFTPVFRSPQSNSLYLVSDELARDFKIMYL